jgi:predicted ATP-grasp superfamily ATP-dependent carboligase
MKYIIALIGFFICFSASAAELRDLAIGRASLPIACTHQIEDAVYNVTVAKEHTLVFKRVDGGGGVVKLYENLNTGDWVLLRFVDDQYVCFIAAGEREVGT